MIDYKLMTNYNMVLLNDEKFNAVALKEIKGVLKDISQDKNLSSGFSSAKEAEKYLGN